jgi:exopolysaccharide biosynthesis WecB/TagA/CpsF family protein
MEFDAWSARQRDDAMTKLTVGIPVFNAMPYLRESVESILQQTYSDFVVLAIDDGSTDGSLNYLKSINDPRLRVVTQPNQGLTTTLNRMLLEVETPWLVRLDADDVAYPDRLARTIEHIERHPDAGMFYSAAAYYPAPAVGQFRSTKGSPKQLSNLVRSGYLPSICHPTVTLNVEKVTAVGGYRFDLHIEDIDLWWRMALKYDIRLIPEVTLGFRQNLNSVSSANFEAQALNTLYVQYLLLSRLWKLEPQPYETVQTQLTSLLDRRRLSFKTHLRTFNIELSRGHQFRAAREALLAFCTSPRDFTDRLFDEFVAGRAIALGVNPSVFAANSERFWPKHSAGKDETVRPAGVQPSSAIASDPEPIAIESSAPLFHTAASLRRVKIGHADVHVTTMIEAVSLIIAHAITSTFPAYVVTPNAQHVVLLENDLRFREVYENASFVVPDGSSLILGAAILGTAFKERVAGVDLFQNLCANAAKSGLRVFLLGGKPGAADLAATALQKAHRGLIVSGTCCPPMGFDQDESQLQDVARAIRACKPQLLFVGLGAPKQENWIYEHGRKLGVPVCIGIGGAFEMVAGFSPRAPKFLRGIGLEWLFRLVIEPRRLWRRYLVGNAQFIAIVFRQLLDSLLHSKHERPALEVRS